MEDHKKVFISYSWAVQKRTVELAERLMANGVDVVMDVYILKEGQDKYAFMENAVNDDTIDRVLIICDKTYATKANNREGGVGDETIIISPEVYGNAKQERFIPVIFELDENNNPYCPHYIKSRIYIDLSTDDEHYESEFEKLLRNIYDKPSFQKPALGNKPEWLESEMVNLSALRDTIRQLKGCSDKNSKKADYLVRRSIDQFSETAKQYHVDDKDSLISAIDITKPFRDVFADYCVELICCSEKISDTICELFETLYNELHDATEKGRYTESDFELYDYMIWELIITCTAILLHFGRFRDLHDIVCHTYFLKEFFLSVDIKPHAFFHFYNGLSTIEEYCKPKSEFKNVPSLAAHILVERERKPYLTKRSLVNADIVLYQLNGVLTLPMDNRGFWFPKTYYYNCETPMQLSLQPIWQKLISKQYCEKIMPLFGADTIEKLKETIDKQHYNIDVRYQNCWVAAPVILNTIKIDEIGSLD